MVILFSFPIMKFPIASKIVSLAFLLLAWTRSVAAYSMVNRRQAVTRGVATLITTSASTTVVPPPLAANAISDNKPAEFNNVGQQEPAPDGQAPFVTLPTGVQIKDYRVGSGNAVADKGCRVSVQLTGRLLNLNGVVFYDSKKNDPDGLGGIPVSFTIGDGTALPGLEAGVVGMKKGGIRRIIVPPALGYNPAGPYLEPIPVNALDQRALDSVVQNARRDATLLFDCKLERLK